MFGRYYLDPALSKANLEASQERRKAHLKARAEGSIDWEQPPFPPAPERRASNEPGRKAWTMEDRLAMQHAKREQAKFSGASLTDFGMFA